MQGRKEQWRVEGQTQPALSAWLVESNEPISRDQYIEAMAASSATEIVRLLNLGQQQQAGFENAQGQLQTLQPNHIAVLVRDLREAQAMRKHLAQRNVRSVFLR